MGAADFGYIGAGLLTAVVTVLARFVWEHQQFMNAAMGRRKSRGVPGEPSVLENVATLQTSVTDLRSDFQAMKSDVTVIKDQLHRNGGKSVADAVYETQRAVASLAEKLDTIHLEGNDPTSP